MEVIKRLVRKNGFLRRVAEVITKDLRGSTAALYQRKWSKFLHWMEYLSMQGHCSADKEIFPESTGGQKLLVPAVKGKEIFPESTGGAKAVGSCS